MGTGVLGKDLSVVVGWGNGDGEEVRGKGGFGVLGDGDGEGDLGRGAGCWGDDGRIGSLAEVMVCKVGMGCGGFGGGK